MDLLSNSQDIFSNPLETQSGHSLPMYAWAKRLNEKFKKAGMTKRQLAHSSGVNYDVVNKCLRGEVENPRGDTMRRLASALGTTEIFLRSGEDSVSDRSQVMQGSPQGEARFLTGAKDLPILGRARGGEEGFFIDNGEVAGFTMRPYILDGVSEAYAVEVFDTSMEPALRHGWLVWVHPYKPVKAGDDVVLQLKDGQALVKHLVRRTEKDLVLRQYSPAKDFKVARADVKSVHLIVGNLRVVTGG